MKFFSNLHRVSVPTQQKGFTVQLAALMAFLMLAGLSTQAQSGNVLSAKNPSGTAATITTAGSFDFNNPFFQSLGTNGRSCVTCHQPTQGWSITPAAVQQRFKQSNGLDPIFRAVDGANCPTNFTPGNANDSTQLLNRGLIRIDRPLPDNAQFIIEVTDDPYNCSTPTDISVYRRPLPSTNLRFLSGVMWDQRENAPGRSVPDDLTQQAFDATLGHAQAAVPPSPATTQAIRDFEIALFTAQVSDNKAGSLTTDGANGGPIALAQQAFFLGINDPFGGNPTGAAFDSNVFNLYGNWAKSSDSNTEQARESIKRGELLFNTFPIPIFGVAGLNGPNDPSQAVIMGTCSTCHNSPNVGDHSLSVPLNIGVADQRFSTSDDPLFTLTNKATGQVTETSDPGVAMVSGEWADIGKFKVPVLRGLAGRAPYFHNGSAKTLEDVVKFYKDRFNLPLSGDQVNDLANFLRSL